MSPEPAPLPGRTPGFRRHHAVVGVVLAVAWIAILAFVLGHGRGEQSAADVSAQLPQDLTSQLEKRGLRYQGISSVDARTQEDVQSRVTVPTSYSGAHPLILRTALILLGRGGQPAPARPALMVVATQDSSSAGGRQVLVEFVDPTSYDVLRKVEFTSTAG